jgi:dolichol-phosphate mannosyltransferase
MHSTIYLCGRDHAIDARQIPSNGVSALVSRVAGALEILGDMGTVMRSGGTEHGRSPERWVEVEGQRSQRDSLVIIPTYNEAGNLEPLIRQALATDVFDILVVDDASPDGTGDIADELARQTSGRVSVLRRPGKLGLGSAYREGFTYALGAGYDSIFQMDADFSHNPVYLTALRHAVNQTDVALGSRYVAGGAVRHWPVWRRWLSRGGSAYAAATLGLPLHDLTSGFKGFRRRALLALDHSAIYSTGYSFQIEVTHRCHLNGMRIVEIPITFEARRVGKSKMSGRIVAEALLLVWRLRGEHQHHRRRPSWSSMSSATH